MGSYKPIYSDTFSTYQSCALYRSNGHVTKLGTENNGQSSQMHEENGAHLPTAEDGENGNSASGAAEGGSPEQLPGQALTVCIISHSLHKALVVLQL